VDRGGNVDWAVCLVDRFAAFDVGFAGGEPRDMSRQTHFRLGVAV
jgi:hypothetical protein